MQYFNPYIQVIYTFCEWTQIVNEQDNSKYVYDIVPLNLSIFSRKQFATIITICRVLPRFKVKFGGQPFFCFNLVSSVYSDFILLLFAGCSRELSSVLIWFEFSYSTSVSDYLNIWKTDINR